MDALGTVTIIDLVLAMEPVIQLEEEREVWFGFRAKDQTLGRL